MCVGACKNRHKINIPDRKTNLTASGEPSACVHINFLLPLWIIANVLQYIYVIIQQEYVPYYDRVASGLNWETRAVVVTDAAGAGGSGPAGISVPGI